jgi:hypothetical protein
MGNVNPPRRGRTLASQKFIDKLAELSGLLLVALHSQIALIVQGRLGFTQ